MYEDESGKIVRVIRKLLQILMTVALLAGASQAYRVGFAQVEYWLRPPAPIVVDSTKENHGPATISKSAIEARQLAAKAFGENHWSAHQDLKIRFYDAQRGFWIYAQNYDSKAQSGSQIRFWAVVFIWRGERSEKEPQNQKLIFGGGDEAIIEMSQPITVIKPGSEPPKIVKATLKGSVTIRDDKGTPSADDDLEVGPMADIRFDEPSLSIFSDSDVRIKDRDLLITGQGLRIELWPRLMTDPAAKRSSEGPESTFSGTKSIQLASKVRIDVANVGKSNVLPGKARDKSTEIPAWLACDGPMRIDMPRGGGNPVIGPPRPPEPTIAIFSQNVRLQRGREQPDQLTGDELQAELFPTTKPAVAQADTKPAAEKAKAGPGGTGPMTELDLKWARMTGKKVVLLSQAQGLTTTGTELILKRPGGNKADEVYIRGTPEEPLFVERIEYVRDRAGLATEQIRSIETMTAQDITLFDEKPEPATTGPARAVANTAIEVATVVARGKGQIEVRDGRNQPVVRSASWSQQAVMVTDHSGSTEKKIITLAGKAHVWDAKSGTLDSAQSLEIWLSPKARPAEVAAVKKPAADPHNREASAGLSSKSYEMERVRALKDVRLVADNRYLSAKQRLDVEFLPGTAAPAQPARDIATKPDARVKPTAFWAADAPADSPATSSGAKLPANAAPAARPNRPGPKVSVDANRIWARLGPNPNTQRPSAGNAPANPVSGGIELIEARLRGDVKFNQENADPAKKASSVEAQAVDVVHQGQAMYHLLAYSFDPSASKAASASAAPVRIVSDQFELDGSIVALDQRASYAKVDGQGQIRQWLGSELLKQEGFQNANTSSSRPTARPAGKPQLATITWKEKMEFMGVPLDKDGNPLLAQAHFNGGVVVRTTDALLGSEQLYVYFDRQVPLDQVRTPGLDADRQPATSASNLSASTPKPEIAYVQATGSVTMINRQKQAQTDKVMQLQRLEGKKVVYDKASDTFQMDRAGIVRLYERNDGKTQLRRLVPGANDKPPANPAAKPFSLTRIEFLKGMSGRLGFDPDANKQANQAKDRSAEFFGNVQVLHGQVSDEFRDLNVDKPPPEFALLSSEWLKVESLANRQQPDKPQNLLFAQGNATARTGDMATQGDQIHFDATAQLFHVFGQNGREVSIVHQTKPGSPPSVARGSALVYNNVTGESQLVDPKTIQLIDPNSGTRPALGPPKPAPVQPRPDRTPIRLPPSSSRERRSF